MHKWMGDGEKDISNRDAVTTMLNIGSEFCEEVGETMESYTQNVRCFRGVGGVWKRCSNTRNTGVKRAMVLASSISKYDPNYVRGFCY